MLKIPIENWSDEELENALNKYFKENPPTENPIETVFAILFESVKRELCATGANHEV